MGAFPCVSLDEKTTQWLLPISTHLPLRGQCRDYQPCWANSPASRFTIGTMVPLAPEAGGTLAGLAGASKRARHRQARYDDVMQALYDFTVDTLFAGFLGDDPAVCSRIAAQVPEGALHNGWRFTLPQLFSWALVLYENAGHKPETDWRGRYIEFRKLLYSHSTNTVLKQHGGAVEIFAAHKDHAQTVYVLRHCTERN